jgi:hypothetical protein
MSEWKDTTGYMRGGPKPGEEPRTWEIQSGTMRVVVTRHLDYPGDWLMRCDEIGCHGSVLKSRDADAAKREALERVLMRGEAIVSRVKRLIGG